MIGSKRYKQFTGELAFLSNMHPCEIKSGKYVYPSTENYYQANKFPKERRVEFLGISPFDAKKKSRKEPEFNYVGREDVGILVMKYAINQKFKDRDLSLKLIMTPEEYLIEYNYWHDNYWGYCLCDKCKDREHKNNLGLILRQERKQIINKLKPNLKEFKHE